MEPLLPQHQVVPAQPEEKAVVRTKQVKLQSLSTAVFFVNIMLLEWWLNPHCRGEKSISWQFVTYLYIYRKDVTLTHECLFIFTHTNLFTLRFFFLNQGATAKILELSNKPQESRSEIRGTAPPFEVLCCGHQPGCSLNTDMDIWWLVS